jgi:hypothetical protein
MDTVKKKNKAGPLIKNMELRLNIDRKESILGFL